MFFYFHCEQKQRAGDFHPPAPLVMKQIYYLQVPASLPAGISHFLDAQAWSRLQVAPAGCGALQRCGVKAITHTVPSLQSLSSLHSVSAAKEMVDNDMETIRAVDNKNLLSICNSSWINFIIRGEFIFDPQNPYIHRNPLSRKQLLTIR